MKILHLPIIITPTIPPDEILPCCILRLTERQFQSFIDNPTAFNRQYISFINAGIILALQKINRFQPGESYGGAVMELPLLAEMELERLILWGGETAVMFIIDISHREQTPIPRRM